MFKFTAIILAFISALSVGFYKAYEIKRRKQLLLEFRDLFLQIMTEIGYFKAPLPLIFQRIKDKNNTSASIILRQCQLHYNIGLHHENLPFSSLWEQAIQETYREEPLKKDDLQLMTKCGVFLGQSDYKNQKQQMELFLSQLDQHIQDADQNIKTKGVLYSKAGLSIGAVIAIAML